MGIPSSLPGFLCRVMALPPAAALQLPLCSSGLSCSRCRACGFNIFLCGLLTLDCIGSWGLVVSPWLTLTVAVSGTGTWGIHQCHLDPSLDPLELG